MNLEKRRILFFIPQWPASNSGVLHSQVLSTARFLSEQGFECMFIGCDFDDEKAALEKSGQTVRDLIADLDLS